MSEYEEVIEEIVKHGVVVKVNKIVDDNYIPYERKYVGCVVELDFSEHDKPFKDKIAELEKRIKELDTVYAIRMDENKELKQRIAELESGLNEMEKMKSHWIDRAVEWQQQCEKLESEKSENCEEEPISDDSRPSAEWYENRYQQDCITINRLNTTIDVLIHKIEYLRQFAGLE